MDYVWAFVVGGLLCVAAQIVADGTPLTPAHTMVLFVILGAVASGLGLYEPLIQFAGAGASVPLPGFGHALVQGIIQDASRTGWVGLFTGGLAATAMGVTAAVLFGFLVAAIFNPRG
ncbi:MAG: stage V sporulation protein AE [Clostridia bacterium]|nr:stage V sporulation protein AE [Clostridia bacterium]